jgi:hypothetical protein
MGYTIQLCVSLLIVAAAAALLLRRAWHTLRGRSSGCGSACGRCREKPPELTALGSKLKVSCPAGDD